MSENILRAFKEELGYVNATNQYVELSVRLAERDSAYNFKKDLQKMAKMVNLSVSTLAEDYTVRISKSYIVNIHSCFENFLKDFSRLPGSPTYTTEQGKKDDSWLQWTLDIALNNLTQEIMNDVYICEYYRLIRNSIVHNGDLSSEVKHKRAQIKIKEDSRLNAINDLFSLTFDDQVLFSRAAYNVADYIFNNSSCSINSIIEAYKEDLLKLIKPLQEQTSRPKAAKKIKRYISLLYPEFTDVDWNLEVNKLLT